MGNIYRKRNNGPEVWAFIGLVAIMIGFALLLAMVLGC